MKVINVIHEAEAPSPHYTYLDATPEAAAMATAEKFGQRVDTVYIHGRRCYVEITVTPEQFWTAVDNRV